MEHGHGFALLGAWSGLFESAGLPGALFLAGLFGGFSHCAAMCGPFVIAQVAARLDRAAGPVAGGELARLAGGVLVAYHLGRMTTYAGLGAAAGLVAGQVTAVTGFGWLIALFLALAALLFLAQGLALWKPQSAGAGAFGGMLARLAQPLLRDPRGWRGYALGVALGFLPCGLLYGALAAAAGAGGPARGALAMAAFTLGTAPALIGVGWVGAFFARRFLPALRAIAAPVMVLNAAVLLVLAWRALG